VLFDGFDVSISSSKVNCAYDIFRVGTLRACRSGVAASATDSTGFASAGGALKR